ncbi:tripartite tricarboxylate transporter substrate binding protein [Aquincola tertiaricarbonis]|uniref:Tripartite tricarboxylate transporter substrate binding protein n=1 Tax=Aquincola tertiaricarbonis TaxID=391953 RepID=A0ABY4SFT7_AQUTE|nr:tripartite tricarboxylate transporter substrate binding protein [Aquincola tertiaricarbonis]URI10767.1 tripartite tricarboxylate transporter substrate binding protein [Aquincola tertiaricarbonis]
MQPTRRLAAHAVTAAFALLAIGAAGSAFAEDKYPSKPVTVIVPQAPGGANDAIARIVAQKLTETLGQQFLVDNRPGAGGNIGTAAAAKARNDGYTLLLTVNSAHVINPALYKSTGFDPVKDFEPISPVATAGYVLVANTGFAPRTVAELITAAKAAPGKYTIASAGNGTLNHLIGEMLGKAAGIELTHVPYKGASAAVTDLVGGQVQVSVQSLPSSISFIKSGKLKVLGVVNEHRVSALPDSPTIGETIKGFGSTPWYGLFAPAGTPKAVITQLSATLAKVLDAPDTKEKLATLGCEPFKGSPEQFATLVKEDLPKWARIVKESGATVD